METNAIKAHGSVLNILDLKLKDIFKQLLEMGYSYLNVMPFPPSLTGLRDVSCATLLLNYNDHRWPVLCCRWNCVLQWQPLQSPNNPAGWGVQAPFLYSRGKCTDVFVPTEGQTDCSKGSTLVEHLCYLRGQIARWGHQHFSKVTCPGCRLFLRSASQKRKVTHFAFSLERKVCKHFKTFYFKK